MELRKDLSAPGLLGCLRQSFSNDCQDQRTTGKVKISLVDALMSGVAMFSMKSPSLLAFDKSSREGVVAENLRRLYGVSQAPSDTQMREILDTQDPSSLRRGFTDLFALLQRGKALEQFNYNGLGYFISIDGTGYFSSTQIHCESCCQKVDKKTGEVSYYHQMLSPVMIHPDIKQVIPLCPEPILKRDGATKNDCEHRAALRLLKDLRREHPHLAMTIVEDSLFSTAPHIKELRRLNFNFIIGAKEGNHKSLFEHVSDEELSGLVTTYETTEKQLTRRYRFINNVPLNAANPELLVNFLEYWETKAGKTLHFSWVTSIPIGSNNAYALMRAGRARWKIENETFNTLKNQGYEFEHNFGHGYQHLSVVLSYLMMLAFLIDQAQLLSCKVFQACRAKFHALNAMWNKMRSYFLTTIIPDWPTLYHALLSPPQLVLASNSS